MATERQLNDKLSEKDKAVLEKLDALSSEGENQMDEEQEEREDGINVWNLSFRNSPPDNSLYYPKLYSMLWYHVMAAEEAYGSADQLTSVTPFRDREDPMLTEIASQQRQEINYHLGNFNENDFSAFVQDSMIQAEQIGGCVGKVYWVQERQVIEIEDTFKNYELGPEGEGVEGEAAITRRETITKNYPVIECFPREDLVWDTTKKVWKDVRWARQKNIEKTEDELLAAVENEGYRNDQVQAFINELKNDSNKDEKESRTYNIAEFWGWMHLPVDGNEDEKRATFVKIVTDNDNKYMLRDPDTNVYRYVDGTPMIPFVVGYIRRRKHSIMGDSFAQKARHLQGEWNCIRNQRRRSVENDLNEKYVVDKNAEVEFERFNESSHGTMIMTNDMEGFKEIRHWDNTSSSYGELEAVDKDFADMIGVNEYITGAVDPHVTDTLGGINMMSASANKVIRSVLRSYNQSFMEPILDRVLNMSLQYMTQQELERAGMDFSRVSRDQMKVRMRLRIDAGYGATSEQVKLNNLTKWYFMVHHFLDKSQEDGVEVGYARYMPGEILRRMAPLLTVKDVDQFIPSPQELEEFTAKMVEERMAMEQRMMGQQMQAMEAGGRMAAEAGVEAARELAAGGQEQ